MPLPLPWFLDLGTGQLVKKRLRVDIVGAGPASGRFRVLGPGDLTLSESETAAVIDDDWSSIPVRMLHTLACAERGVWLLERLTGLKARWAPYPNLPLNLYSHSRAVKSFDAAETYFAWYASNQAAIHFEYVDGNPWLSACLAHDLVIHEVCHGFLHGVLGWLNASEETIALTESLGDLLAMFSAGRLIEVRRRALQETGGDLSGHGNVLSRFAEVPGFGHIRRDISAPVTRAFVEAKYPAGTKERIYGLAVVLSSALYEALSRRFSNLQGGVPEKDLSTALIELSAVVFGVLGHLPKERVSFAEFVDLVVTAAEDELAEILAVQFLAQGVV